MKKAFRTKILWALFLLFIVVILGHRLWFPPVPYFDEVHSIKFVRQMIYDGSYGMYATTHPPLWHILTALCIAVLGDVSLAWRLVSFVAGLGVYCMVYLLTTKLTRDKTVAFLAAFLLLFDCLSLTQARIGMVNALMLFFSLLSVYFFFDSFKQNQAAERTALSKSGIFFGLALSTKLVALNLFLFFIPLMMGELLRRPSGRVTVLRNIGVYFIIFPAVLFSCVHIFVPFLKENTLADIWKIWTYNVHYHTTTTQTHGYTSRWWSWPLLLRPVSFYFKSYNWNTATGACQNIMAMGNPVIFWVIPFAIFDAIWEFFQKKSRAHGLILLGFLSQWASFALAARIQFFHYFYLSMPFVVMALALLLAKIYRSGKWGKILVVAYLVAVAGMFVYWYPLLTGLTVSKVYFYQHMWFKKWI